MKIIEQPHNFHHENRLKVGKVWLRLFSSKPPSYSFGPFTLNSTTLQKPNPFPNLLPLPLTLKTENTVYVETLEYVIKLLNVESRSYV